MNTPERKAKLEQYKDSWIYEDLKAKLQRRYNKHKEGLITGIDVSDVAALAVARAMMREVKIMAQEFDIELT